jgi:hypothetical protein
MNDNDGVSPSWEETVSDPGTADQQLQTGLALGSVAFALCVGVSMLANDAPSTATVCQVGTAACLALIGSGWLMPVFARVSFIWFFDRTLGRLRKPGESAGNAVDAGMIGLGSLILMLTSAWGYLAFGLFRMGGNPSWEATGFTLSLLAGGAGLLFLQRWAAVLVSGTGWWWLWRLLELKATSSVDPHRWTVAFCLAALALPMSGATLASWRYLKNGWKG